MDKADLLIKNPADIPRVVAGYEKIVLLVLNEIITRYGKKPDYHFIDTKLDIMTGKDFPAADQVRGKKTIYSWIQSRGLEAMVIHAEWINSHTGILPEKKAHYQEKIRKLVTEVSCRMESIRQLNHGHIPCMMTADGIPLRPSSPATVKQLPVITESPGSLSDLFYVKGLAAAANFLCNKEKFASAECKFKGIIEDLWTNCFVFDQYSLDPKNRIRTNCILEGGFMIAIGGTGLFLRLTKNPGYWEMGIKLIKHIIENYVNTVLKPECCKPYDMWEENDLNGKPFLTDKNQLKSDPGHALEFAGLSFKLIYIAEQQKLIDIHDWEIQKLITVLAQIVKVNFTNGFTGKGIVKAFDLISQQAMNTDLPWWSLPESMRAAKFAHYFTNDPAYLDIFCKCSNAFAGNFLNEEVHWMAYQTIDQKGCPIRVIPATPDADPGYHTGLSLLDIFATP